MLATDKFYCALEDLRQTAAFIEETGLTTRAIKKAEEEKMKKYSDPCYLNTAQRQLVSHELNEDTELK
jgi:hypothetical protein